MSLAHRAVRGTAYILVSSYLNLVFGFVTTILLTRMLTPEAFGIVSLAIFFLGLFDLRSKLGFDYAFVQRQPTTAELFGSYLALQLGFGLISVAFALAAFPLLGALGYAPEVRDVFIILALLTLIDAAGTPPRVALEKELNFKRSSLTISAALLCSNIVAVLMAMAGFGYWSLVAQIMVNSTVGALGFWGSSHIRPTLRFDGAIVRWMLRFGRVMFIGSLATLTLLQFDNFLIGTFISTAALGYYERAYKVAQWPTGLITHVVSRSAMPTYAKLQDDRARLSKAFNMTLWLIITLSLPLALGLFVSAPDFILLIFGPAWLPSAIFLRFLVGYSLLRPLIDDTGALFTAVGRPRLSSTVLSAQAIALVIVATPLTFAFGAAGTAVGVGIAFAVGVILAYRYVAQRIDLSLRDVFVKPLVAAAVTLAVYALVAHTGDLNSIPLLARVVLKLGLALTTCTATLLVIDRERVFAKTSYILRLLKNP